MRIIKFIFIGLAFFIILIASSCHTNDNQTISVTSPPGLPAETTPEVTPDATSVLTNPYNPAQYGIPETLGGYKVIAVFTPQDVACMLEGQKQIILQAQEAAVHEFLEQPHSPREILETLQEIPGEEQTHWQIQFVGPGGTLEGAIETLRSWNAIFADRPCFTLGGPLPTLTYTSTP
jgi:hypothetical protein